MKRGRRGLFPALLKVVSGTRVRLRIEGERRCCEIQGGGAEPTPDNHQGTALSYHRAVRFPALAWFLRLNTRRERTRSTDVPTVNSGHGSEVELERKLNLPRRISLAADCTKADASHSCTRGAQDRLVEGIEKLPPKLQFSGLAKGELSEEREIVVPIPIGPQNIAAEITESIQRRGLER